MKISVIIPHLNQPQALARCLASLRAGTRAPDEILVVDNGSAALPEQEVAGTPGARLLQETEPGPGPARNLGVRTSSGEILAFIDADCLAHPGWLASIEARFARAPEDGILGGDVRIARADPDRPNALEAYESVFAYRMDRYIAQQGFTGTGNLAVRREVWERVGPFAGYGVAEDRDWGLRATALGLRTRYVPEMIVYHPARESFAELVAKWDRHSAHDFRAAATRPGGRLKFALKTALMPLSILAHVPRVLTCDRLTGLRARLLALAVLCRVRLYRMVVMARLLAGLDPDQLSGRWNRT